MAGEATRRGGKLDCASMGLTLVCGNNNKQVNIGLTILAQYMIDL